MSYQDPCPKCGARLIGFTKDDYIKHLWRNGETLAARIESEVIVPEPSGSKQKGTASMDSATRQER